MTARNSLMIQGHPDGSANHLCHELAAAYATGAHEAGHVVRWVRVADLDFPLLRSQQEWEHGPLPAGLQQAQDDIRWASHIVLFFPLWLGDMPALLKGFLEQVARPGFAFEREGGAAAFTRKGLKGKSARVVVTMGMPAIVYKWFYRAHSLKSFERNILHFCGIRPVWATVIGMVEDKATREKALAAMRRYGAKAA